MTDRETSQAGLPALLLPCRLAPEPAWYRMMARHDGPAGICVNSRFDKRCKAAHRFTIADTRGPLELTVPIAKPYGRTWADTAVSLHGEWWRTMATALESAYGRTPYFEFYADEFLSIIADPGQFTSVGDLCLRFDRAIRHAIGLTKEVAIAPAPAVPAPVEPWQPAPYWQVRRDALGFLPSLSILDLVFNLGPETLPVISH